MATHTEELQGGFTLGDFQVYRQLGAGKMGVVYLARHSATNREMALKVLNHHLAVQKPYVTLFYREARAMTRLDHPGIVGIYEAGETQGFHHIAMEFVHGYSLEFLQDKLGGRLRPGDALFFTLRTAEALRHAHERKVIHRDVKPTNILISDLGRVKLTDLGLALLLDEELSPEDSGTWVGTPLYMAPEQAQRSKNADASSDIYALGGVLYELLTGRPPFDAETSKEVIRLKELGRFTSARRLNPNVPERLDLVLGRMLSKNPRDRYRNCDELIRDVQRLNLAHEHPSFNVLRVGGALSEVPVPRKKVELLLIAGPEAIALAREALRNDPLVNLQAVGDTAELRSYARREEPFRSAPQPHLLSLGLDPTAPQIDEILQTIEADATLRSLPLMLQFPAGREPQELPPGLETALRVRRPEDAAGWQRLIAAVHGLAAHNGGAAEAIGCWFSSFGLSGVRHVQAQSSYLHFRSLCDRVGPSGLAVRR